MSDELLIRLKEATEGLLYPSECDSSLEPFVWEEAENTEAAIRRLAEQPEKSWCRTTSAEEFFGEVDEISGFHQLHQTLQGILSDLKVYRFGVVEVSVYVVGRAEDGRLAGFKTLSVET